MVNCLLICPEVPFLGKFGPKSQNYQFKMKFGTYTNANMQNSIAVFTFFVFDRNPPFWANFIQKSKLSVKRRNLVASLIRKSRIQRCWSLFLFDWKYLFWGNLVQTNRITSLSWNSVPRLIPICRVQWGYSLLLFLTGNTLLGKIWSKKSQLSV